MKKTTVGQVAVDLMARPENDHTVTDQMRENLTDYDKNIWECVITNKKQYPGDFYIVVECKKERLLENVLRNFFFARSTAPTPTWDQAVYKYHKADDFLEFLWVIPSKPTCQYLAYHRNSVVESEQELLKFVLEFHDGTLLKRAKKLNGETEDSPLLEEKP